MFWQLLPKNLAESWWSSQSCIRLLCSNQASAGFPLTPSRQHSLFLNHTLSVTLLPSSAVWFLFGVECWKDASLKDVLQIHSMALLLCTHWGPEHPALLAHGRTKAILIFTFRKLFSLAFRDVLFLFGFDEQVKQHVEFPGPCCSLDDKHVKSSMKTGYYCFRTSKHCMLCPWGNTVNSLWAPLLLLVVNVDMHPGLTVHWTWGRKCTLLRCRKTAHMNPACSVQLTNSFCRYRFDIKGLIPKVIHILHAKPQSHVATLLPFW